jgi:hypothetical protein
MSCLQEMMRVNMRQNLQVAVQIATKYSDILGPVTLIEMFESFKTFEGAFTSACFTYLSLTCVQAYITTWAPLST